MRLSTRARYGLRALVSIARRPGAPSTSEAIAGTEDVSKKYLDEILGRLRAAGFLKSVRGANGGYLLASPPREILVGGVVEALEGGLAVVPCVEDASGCARAASCPTRPIWCAVSRNVREALNKTTLADLAGSVPAEEAAGAMYFI